MSFTTATPEWSIQPTPNPSGVEASVLKSVSCVSSAMCVGVGYSQNPNQQVLAESWNGLSWTIVPTPVPAGAVQSALKSVSCFSAAACTAVGEIEVKVGSGYTFNTLAERWNGTQWTVQSSANAGSFSVLEGVACPTATVCEAVGRGEASTDSLAEVWKNGVWSLQSAPDVAFGLGLTTVSCVSVKSCEALSNFNEQAAHWNGVAWSSETPPHPAQGVSCPSASVCVAVGAKGGSLGGGPWSGTAETETAGTWSADSLVYPSGAQEEKLQAVECSTTTSCIATGTYKNSAGEWLPWVEELSGSQWRVHAVPNPEGSQTGALSGTELDGVSCAIATECTAVGAYINSAKTTVTLAETSGP
jgi:hypothetical protein